MGRKRKQQDVAASDYQTITDYVRGMIRPEASNIGTYTSNTSSGDNWLYTTWDEPPTPIPAKQDPEYRFGIEGVFQGVLVSVPDINILEDSPVDLIVRTTLGMDEDDELLSVLVRRADGEVEVRPWRRVE